MISPKDTPYQRHQDDKGLWQTGRVVLLRDVVQWATQNSASLAAIPSQSLSDEAGANEISPKTKRPLKTAAFSSSEFGD